MMRLYFIGTYLKVIFAARLGNYIKSLYKDSAEVEVVNKKLTRSGPPLENNDEIHKRIKSEIKDHAKEFKKEIVKELQKEQKELQKEQKEQKKDIKSVLKQVESMKEQMDNM